MINYMRDIAGGGWRGWFILKDSRGLIRTGVPSGEFAVTVVNPQDDASLTPVVSESSQKPGLYSFLITDAFVDTHGLGSYGTVVEVTATGPRLNDVVGGAFGCFEGVLARRENAWLRGRIVIENDDELVYYAEDGITVLYRNQKLDNSREVLAP